ncbi:DNA-deoxyinosine glycosylase [Paracidovorax sp. MALMAid1276]|uniref:DNA-deoxyinosine glycosylase n=1 Tax=Paracidovorax sp. MALMAid1276 TaxID=3411631 RepID=UPI003B99BFA4
MPQEAAAPERLHGLPPVVSPGTAVLVLGSFPGVASLRARQYYGHPQNHFWRILQALWPQHPLPGGAHSYALRCQWLLDRGLGVWDVYASCLRQGSLDAAIRDPVVNDFALLRAHCPGLRAIAHNGAESFRHAPAVLHSLQAGGPGHGAAPPIESIKLPSTSPANASWSFERKLAAWADLMARHGML